MWSYLVDYCLGFCGGLAGHASYCLCNTIKYLEEPEHKSKQVSYCAFVIYKVAPVKRNSCFIVEIW